MTLIINHSVCSQVLLQNKQRCDDVFFLKRGSSLCLISPLLICFYNNIRGSGALWAILSAAFEVHNTKYNTAVSPPVPEVKFILTTRGITVEQQLKTPYYILQSEIPRSYLIRVQVDLLSRDFNCCYFHWIIEKPVSQSEDRLRDVLQVVALCTERHFSALNLSGLSIQLDYFNIDGSSAL